MKLVSKQIVSLVAIIGFVIGCKDQDLTDPSLILLGDASVKAPFGSVYSDAGAKAIDDQDGDITSRIITTGKPSGFEAGKFTINYKVSDNSQNFAPDIKRNVTISYTGIQINGNYSVESVCDSGAYNFSIELRDTTNNMYQVVFSNFGNTFSTPVFGFIDGTQITVPLQYPIPDIVFSAQGNGTISLNTEGNFIIDMDYKIITDTATTNCNMVATMQ